MGSTAPTNLPELVIPIFRSVHPAPPASAAASPLSTDLGAAWLEAAPVVATATDSEARRPLTLVTASPACLVIQHFESCIDPVTGQLDIKSLDISGNRDDDDTPSSGMVDPNPTEVERDPSTSDSGMTTKFSPEVEECGEWTNVARSPTSSVI